jgi:hypothetical protein
LNRPKVLAGTVTRQNGVSRSGYAECQQANNEGIDLAHQQRFFSRWKA